MSFYSRAIGLGLMGLATYAGCSDSALHNVSVSVGAVSEINVTGSVTLSVTSGSAGTGLATASDSSAMLSFTTNSMGTKKITASTSSSMPPGIGLSVSAALDGSGVRVNNGSSVTATSEGTVQLSTTPTTVISNVNRAVIRNAPLTYTLTAKPDAGEMSATAITITYTITNA